MKSILSKLELLKYRSFSNAPMVGCAKEYSPWSHLSLPNDYVEFLEEFPSTGIFDEDVACRGIESSPGAPDGVYPITMLFAACDNKSYDLVELSKIDNDLPKHLLFIGDDIGGNGFFMDLAESDIGKIYFLDHDLPVESGLSLLATSFSDFVERLHIY